MFSCDVVVFVCGLSVCSEWYTKVGGNAPERRCPLSARGACFLVRV